MMALITLLVPILFPIIKHLGLDPIWFGVIVVLVSQMGVLTPPVGVNVYVVKALAPEVPLERIFLGTVPFLIAIIVATAIVVAFPSLSLLLPGLVR